jgi:hypothetical protein
MKWTIREMLIGTFFLALALGIYWNSQQGNVRFILWPTAVLSIAGVPLYVYRYTRDRQFVFLLAAIVCAVLAVCLWIIASEPFG